MQCYAVRPWAAQFLQRGSRHFAHQTDSNIVQTAEHQGATKNERTMQPHSEDQSLSSAITTISPEGFVGGQCSGPPLQRESLCGERRLVCFILWLTGFPRGRSWPHPSHGLLNTTIQLEAHGILDENPTLAACVPAGIFPSAIYPQPASLQS